MNRSDTRYVILRSLEYALYAFFLYDGAIHPLLKCAGMVR